MEPHLHHRHNDEPLDDELVSAYLDGELTGDEQAQIEQRMAANAEFRQMVDELRGLRTSLDALPSHRLPADFAERVLRRAEQQVLMGAHDPSSPLPGSVSPPIALAALENGPPIELAGEPAPITLPPRPPAEDRWVQPRGGFRPFIWTMIAAAAALLIFITNRQPEIRDVPIAKSPEAEQKARQSARSEPSRADETRADGGGLSGAAATKGNVLDQVTSDKKEQRIDEVAPALNEAVPAPDDIADRLNATPENASTRSALSAAGDDLRDIPKAGRAAERPLPAPIEERGESFGNASADKAPFREKGGVVNGGSPGASPAASANPNDGNDAANTPGVTAGFDRRGKIGKEVTRQLDRTDSREAIQEEHFRFGNQLGQVGAAAKNDDFIVVQVTLTPEAARSGAFDAVLAENGIQLEDRPLPQAAEQEVRGAVAAPEPATVYDREEVERVGQAELKQAHDSVSGPARESELSLKNRNSNVRPNSAPESSADKPADPRLPANARGRSVRAQPPGNGVEPSEPAHAREIDAARSLRADEQRDADRTFKAESETTRLRDGERSIAKSDVAGRRDLEVVVVTASANQIVGALAALEAQKELFPSVRVTRDFELPPVKLQQQSSNRPSTAGVAGGGAGGFGGGVPESATPSQPAFRRRSPATTPAQTAPSTFEVKPRVDNKRELDELESAQSSDLQKAEGAKKSAAESNDTLSRSAGGNDASRAGKDTLALPVQLPNDAAGEKGASVQTEPPLATQNGVARRMRFESLDDVLRVQSRHQQQSTDEPVSTARPAAEPPSDETAAKAADPAAPTPPNGNTLEKSIDARGAKPNGTDTAGSANALADAKSDSAATRSANSHFATPRGPNESQFQRRVLFVFRIVEPAIAGQSDRDAGIGSASRTFEAAREAAGQSQLERVPAAPAAPQPSDAPPK